MSFRGHQPTDTDEERIERLSETVAKNVQKISKNVNALKKIIDEMALSSDLDTFRNKVPGMQELVRDSNTSLNELSQLSQMMASKTWSQQMPTHPTLNNSNVFNRNTNPQFSVEKFMNRSRLMAAKSHFYEGKTVFGGANMSRAARLAGTTPYSLALRQQISREVIPKVRFEASNEPLSSSSQRILEKLKSLSTPLNDAKRIPVSYRKNDYFRDAELLHRTTKRAKWSDTPSVSQNETTNPFQTKRTYRLVEMETTEDNKSMITSDVSKPLVDSCDKYSNESIENKSNETFIGKIMRKDSKREDKRPTAQTATNSGQNDPSFDLLTTAEPLSMPSSLPKFSFGSKPVEKSSVKSTTQIIKVTEDCESNFKFSEPVLKIRDQKSDSIKTNKTDPKVADKQLEFSSPQSSAITNKISIGLKKAEKQSNASKDLVKESTDLQSIDSKQTNDSQIKTEIKKTVKNTDQWVCPKCLFANTCSDEKCKACNREHTSLMKPTAPPLSSSSSSDLSANKTIPLTTSTTGWGKQFLPKAGSWTCATCCVTNDSDKSKCVACEEPKPGATLSNSTKQSSVSKPKTWQCSNCKHNNKESNRVCNSCAKCKAIFATKEQLDELYGGPAIKFGISESKSSPKNDKKVEEKTEVLCKSNNSTLLPKQTDSSSESTSNTFVFGSTSLTGDKTKVPSISIQSNDTTSQPLFKFGVPSTQSIPEFKSPEKSNTNIADIFGSNKTTNSSVAFTFGALPPITSPTSSQEKPEVNKSSADSTFSFGINEELNRSQSREKRKPIHLENENTSETTPKSSTNQSGISFQIPKTIEDKPLFKGFTSTASGSTLFGSTTSSTTSLPSVATTSASITSFSDNKFNPLKSTETQNKSLGSLFGSPATTTSSNISFSSPFSLTNSFSSGQTLTSNAGQNNTEGNGVKSLFSMPSSSIKPLISSQTNPLVSSSSVSSSAPLNSITSSSQKGLVFGNSSQPLQSFTSQPSIATTKPNFSFNLGAKTTSANTTATTVESTSFGTNSTVQFGSNPNKGFSFGNPSLSSSQTPSFSFTNPTTNLTPNSTSQMSFGLNSNSNNTVSADTNTKTSNLFQFGGQTTDQFSSSSAQKTLNNNNLNNNLKTSSQFSFGILPSNPSTGQTNNNLFANAISSAQNSLSFTQLGSGTGATAALSPSPFTFGGFNSSAPSMPQMQSQPQQQSQTSLPPPQFNFSAQPSFDFSSMTNPDNTPSTGPVFQFSADNTSQAVAPNRNIKRAKRRLPNTTT